MKGETVAVKCSGAASVPGVWEIKCVYLGLTLCPLLLGYLPPSLKKAFV